MSDHRQILSWAVRTPNEGIHTQEEEEPMPRQWLTKYGMEQSRREGSALFPPELVISGHRFTLELDGMHAALATEQGIAHLVLERGCVASLLDWIRLHTEWVEEDLDPEYAIEDRTADCSSCYRNLAHTRAHHRDQLERVREQREQLAKILFRTERSVNEKAN